MQNIQIFPNRNWSIQSVNRRLRDQFIQKWTEDIRSSPKGRFHLEIKHKLELEKHPYVLPGHLSLTLLRFRTSNHSLPVDICRWTNVDLGQRIYDSCRSGRGDEKCYIFECDFLTEKINQKLWQHFIHNKPSHGLNRLFVDKNIGVMRRLGKCVQLLRTRFLAKTCAQPVL